MDISIRKSNGILYLRYDDTKAPNTLTHFKKLLSGLKALRLSITDGTYNYPKHAQDEFNVFLTDVLALEIKKIQGVIKLKNAKRRFAANK